MAEHEPRNADVERVWDRFLAGPRAPDSVSFRELLATQPAETHEDLEELWRDYCVGADLLDALPSVPPESCPGLGPTDALRAMSRGANDGYERPRLLAKGGMSLIETVVDPRLGRTLARKVLPIRVDDPSLPATARRRLARFLNEIRITSRLQHPAILTVVEAGIDEKGRPFFAMPVVRGEDLDKVLGRTQAKDAAWSQARALGILVDVCDSVGYAHGRGIVHRDLKPQNIMVGAFGETFVMDWGLATTCDERNGESNDHEAPEVGGNTELALLADLEGVTLEGDVVGTPAFMSPEQAAGTLAQVGPASDQYALGAILYQLLSGRRPYEDTSTGTTAAELIHAVRSARPTRVRELAPEVPAELEAICEKAMARKASDRYPDVTALALDLRAFLEGRVVRAHRTGAWIELRKWMQRHRGVVAAIAIVILTLITSAVTFAALYETAQSRLQSLRVARADSIRRIGALRPMAPVGTRLPSFCDDFSDGRLDRRWIVPSGVQLVSERDGTLNLTSASDCGTIVELDKYVSVVTGDFDFSVRFRLEDFEVPQKPLAEHLAGIAVLEPTGRLVAELTRRAERDPPDCMGSAQAYRATGKDPRCLASTYTPGNDVAGRLRIERIGSEIRSYFWRDGWVCLRTDRCTPADVILRIFCRSWYAHRGFRFSVDDLQFTTTSEAPRREPDYVDRFDGTQVDNRLVIGGAGGLAAEIDGKLMIERLEGRAGGISVDLDHTRYTLRRDFAVSVDFELLEFPRPSGPGAHWVTLRVQHQNMNFALVEYKRTASKDTYVAHDTNRRREVATDHQSGKLRIRRLGERFLMEYWDGSWRELYVRDHVAADLDFSFKIQVHSKDSTDGLVVALDNLEVAHVQHR